MIEINKEIKEPENTGYIGEINKAIKGSCRYRYQWSFLRVWL